MMIFCKEEVEQRRVVFFSGSDRRSSESLMSKSSFLGVLETPDLGRQELKLVTAAK